ncbi:hypothetical protein M0Q28_04845 [Patescibacteria group bacterium]|jgi:hypothetical protein|nr:hypothetical protein [Patescibacteria group bacterium]
MTKNLWMMVASATLALSLASTAQAQDSCPAHAHLRAEVRACGASGADFDCTCVCDAGYSPRDGGVPSASNPCERNEPSWGSYSDPLCAFGAERGANGECMCPASLGSRRARSLVIVTRDFAESIADQIENFDSVRRGRGVVALQACIDPLATAGADGSAQALLVDAIDQRTRILCGSAEGASDEQVLADCRATRELIESIRGMRAGQVTIHHGDRDYTVQEFVDSVLVPLFGEIQSRLAALEAQVGDHEERLDELEPRVAALEARPAPSPDASGSDGRNSFTLAVGAFGLVGIHTAGPMTGAGGLSLALHYRPDLAPLDIYARAGMGWQLTGYSVGDTPYVAGAAGVSIYLGATRRDTMLEIGLWGENLWDPASDPAAELQADSLGWSFGGELAVSIPLHPNVRLVPGVAIGGGERRYLGNGDLVVLNGAVITPTVRIEALFDSF